MHLQENCTAFKKLEIKLDISFLILYITIENPLCKDMKSQDGSIKMYCTYNSTCVRHRAGLRDEM